MESAADEIHNFETVVVPGLLQTADYARAISEAAAMQPRPDAVEQRVAARLERQKLVTEGRLRLHAVIDEAVLHRQIGGPQLMHAQLTALMAATKLHNVTLQVIDFKEGPYASMLSSFHILRFPDGPNVVYIEGLTGDLYAEDDDVERCTVVFNSLRSSALSPGASAAMIKRIRDTEHQG